MVTVFKWRCAAGSPGGFGTRVNVECRLDLDALARLTKSLLSIDTFAFPTRQTRRFFEEI